jgi:hypothetical protein
MTDQGPIIMQGIEIPVPKNRELSDFLTPDWTEVVEFYPEFCKQVLAKEDVREEPWDPQPYLLMFAKYLERLKVREGRDADAWMQRILEHFGLPWFMAVVEDMIEAKKAAVGDD